MTEINARISIRRLTRCFCRVSAMLPLANARTLGDAFRQPVAVSVPTLMLVGDLCARGSAQEIAATLPQAQFGVCGVGR